MSFTSVFPNNLSTPVFSFAIRAWGRRWYTGSCLRRFPHIVNITETTARISWIARAPSNNILEVVSENSQLTSFPSDSPGPHHSVHLAGLESDTQYEYWISANGTHIEGPFYFRTRPRRKPSEIVFFVVGDTGSTKPSQYRIASEIDKRLREQCLQFGLHTGDVCHRKPVRHNEEREYFHPYRDVLAEIPVWLAVGNHDIRDKQERRPHPKHYFMPGNGRWYSIDYGPLHVVFLDSNDYRSEQQLKWLTADLIQNAGKPWKFAVLHHPPYALPYTDRKKGRNANDSHLGIRECWCPLFERFGVQMVFSGHNHSYQRSRPIADYEPEAGKVQYIVTGGGGARLHPIGRSGDEPEIIECHAERHHFLQVTLTDTQCNIEAVDDRGTVFDRFTVSRKSSSTLFQRTVA